MICYDFHNVYKFNTLDLANMNGYTHTHTSRQIHRQTETYIQKYVNAYTHIHRHAHTHIHTLVRCWHKHVFPFITCVYDTCCCLFMVEVRVNNLIFFRTVRLIMIFHHNIRNVLAIIIYTHLLTSPYRFHLF